MSKDFIDNRIDASHNLIDQGDFQGAVNILKNIKIRIHDPVIEQKIKDFEKQHDEEVKNKIEKIQKTYLDSITEYGNESEIAKRYAIAYLNFYDTLRKEHEIY